MNKIVTAGTEFRHGATQAAEGFPRHAWTLAEFEQLSQLGYFGGIDGPRKLVELIGGEIVPMASKGARHELVKGRLTNYLARKLPADFDFHVELGWRPGGDIYCEPDFLICPALPRAERCRAGRGGPAHRGLEFEPQLRSHGKGCDLRPPWRARVLVDRCQFVEDDGPPRSVARWLFDRARNWR